MRRKPSRDEEAPARPLSPRRHQLGLVAACREGDVGAVRRLLQTGGLQVRNAQGAVLPSWSRRDLGYYYQQTRLVEFSLDKVGADVAAISQHGEDAVHVALYLGKVTLLCVKGEGIDTLGWNGRTSLHIACSFCDEYMVVLLLRGGASTDVKDEDGQRPLHKALWSFFWRKVEVIPIIQDLILYGDAWDDQCDDALTANHAGFLPVREEDSERWQRVWPALRFATLLWMDERRLGLPLSNIPVEQIERGLEATQTYAQELQASQQIVCRRTICVVGPSTAGKTSIIKSLIEKDACLESADDRTIGIDHFTLQFAEPSRSQAAWSRLHEVRFSDFAGQDVYQVMHSLFFTRRTLFLIAVDLNAYSIALLKSEMLTQDDAKLQHLMNEYVDRTVLSWIRIVMARQPDAEFVFVCTKEDTLASGPGVDKQEVLSHVKMMLERVVVIVQGMKPPPEHSLGSVSNDDKQVTTPNESDEPFIPSETGEPIPIPKDIDEEFVSPITHLWDVRLEKCCQSNVKIIETTATTAASAQQARHEIERLIIENDKGYDTPEKHMRVLSAVLARKEAAERLPIHRRIQESFVDVNELITQLQQNFAGLSDETEAKNILRTLRDCVDILWYEDLDDTKLQTTVILDPKLLIEFFRQVINHNHASGTISHAILSGLPFWKDLNGDHDAMRSMKRLLQTFKLVHPVSGEMAFDSDLIVPTYWKIKQPALWKFGGERLRLNPRGFEVEIYARRVHWELRFTHFIPDTLFDHLNVSCYSPGQPLEAGPDWILYRHGKMAACRMVVSRHWTTHERSMHVEAVVADETQAGGLWRIFTRVCKALASVLKEHPGLLVTRFAHTASEGYQPSLASIARAIDAAEMDDQTWMPPEPVASECIKALAGR